MNLDWMPIADSTLGCDFSGTVDKIGPNVKRDFKVGDRVFGWVLGNNIPRKDNGGFAEYCAANSDFLLRTPEGMSDEEAASPPAGIATAGSKSLRWV
jgi:NADPH:quinone reductase-like Zn-dependent oxidoreductase